MHSSEQQLRSLLSDDENSQELKSIAEHVEHCATCQGRLERLTGYGQWTQELVNTLRDDASATTSTRQDSFAGDFKPPMTVVLDQVADLDDSNDDSNIEFDPVTLDFLSDATHPELLGRLGRYDIERVIGAGGMGLVLKGFDGELHRPVAIKVLAPHLAHSAAARKRFAREAQATAAVIHPHVIPIHNVETSDKLPYLVMNYINGSSLQWHVDTHGPLSIEETLRIALQTTAGMRAAHEQGLIHRDVKPANILLEEGTLRVVLSDFGLARTMDDASLTRTGIVTGTPHYMSPEQAGGDAIDHRSDLFSLGCVIYFMLTGRPPFRAATALGVLNRICHETHRPVREVNSLVPKPLADIVDRLLSKQAEDRYATAENLEHALGEVMRAWHDGSLKLVSRSSSWLATTKLYILKRRSLISMASLLLLGTVSIVFGNQIQTLLRPNRAKATSAVRTVAPPPLDAWQQSFQNLRVEFDLYEQLSGPPQWAQTWNRLRNQDLYELNADIEALLKFEEEFQSR